METQHTLRAKRKGRVRAKVNGTADRPRLSVFKSNTSISAQIIDDVKAITIISLRIKGKSRVAGKELGVGIAKLALGKGVKTVVFDRNGYRFHGVVREVAESAKAGGLTI